MKESQADFARRVGVHRSQISRWKKQGMPVNDDGTLEVETALEWVSDNVYGREHGDDENRLVALRCQKMKAEIELLELRKQREKRELVDRRRAEKLVFELAQQIKHSWQLWPQRVAPELAAEIGCDPHQLEQALDRAVRQQLREMANATIDLAK